MFRMAWRGRVAARALSAIASTPTSNTLQWLRRTLGAAAVAAISVTALDRLRAHADDLAPALPWMNQEIPLDALPSRSAIINRLQDQSIEYDVLVVGGGATGVGCALDAQTRGLKVALVERDDFAAGTSSRSTKLIHGGMRYLEKAFLNLDYGQYKLVHEALHERSFFFRAAPHLARPLPIILPIYDSFPSVLFYAPYYWIGCKAYDLVAGKDALEPSHWLSHREALEKFPMLRHRGLKGGTVYYDGQMNDSRMCLAVAQTAIAHGAACANHVEVTELMHNADGRVCGARVRDQISGAQWAIRAKTVVNAGGPFADSIRNLDASGRAERSPAPMVSPSAGVHVLLPSRFSPTGMGLIAPSSDGRVLFLLPWQGSTIAGTTDSSAHITALPRPHDDEIDFILREISKFLDVNVTRADVDAAWSGLRPLARDPHASDTQSISRDHVVTVDPRTNLLTVAGGKWTTYRKMAEDVVDKLTQHKCVSGSVQVLGAAGWSMALPSLLEREGLSPSVAQHLADMYGDKAEFVAALAAQNANPRDADSGGKGALGPLARPLATGFPFIEAEVVYATRHEYAQTAVDVLARRTRLAFLHRDAAVRALPRVVDIMSGELGWDARRRAEEMRRASVFLKTMGAGSEPEDDRSNADRDHDYHSAFPTAPAL